MGHGAHEPVDGDRGLRPVDLSVLGPTAAEDRRPRRILGSPRRHSRAKERNGSPEERHRGGLEFAHQGKRRLPRSDRYALLGNDVAGVRALRHVMEGDSGLGLAVQDDPVGGAAPAVARQQRAVEVERSAMRDLEERRCEESPIVEGEEDVGPEVPNPLDE